MKIYIASFFADKDRVKQRGAELQALGIEFTSRWVDENAPRTATIHDYPEEYFRETAVLDLEDIYRADKLILTIPSDRDMTDLPVRSLTRGGRHFESGFMYGILYAELTGTSMRSPRELILLGDPENTFHFLDGLGAARKYPAIRRFETWEVLKAALQKEMEEACLKS